MLAADVPIQRSAGPVGLLVGTPARAVQAIFVSVQLRGDAVWFKNPFFWIPPRSSDRNAAVRLSSNGRWDCPDHSAGPLRLSLPCPKVPSAPPHTHASLPSVTAAPLPEQGTADPEDRVDSHHGMEEFLASAVQDIATATPPTRHAAHHRLPPGPATGVFTAATTFAFTPLTADSRTGHDVGRP
jgi:hypothetical protein